MLCKSMSIIHDLIEEKMSLFSVEACEAENELSLLTRQRYQLPNACGKLLGLGLIGRHVT
jgi:hypothetical protein